MNYADPNKILLAKTHLDFWNIRSYGSHALEMVKQNKASLMYSHSERLSDNTQFHQFYNQDFPESPFAVIEFSNGERLFLNQIFPEVRLARKPEDFSFCVHFEQTMSTHHDEIKVDDYVIATIWPFAEESLSSYRLEFKNQWMASLRQEVQLEERSEDFYYLHDMDGNLCQRMLKAIEQLESKGLKYSEQMEAQVLKDWGYGAEQGGGIYREKEILTKQLKEMPPPQKNQTNQLYLKINKI